jgi:MFS family permease
MLPIRLWRNRVIALDNGGNFAMGMVMLSVTAFLPLYVQGVMGRSATATGAVLGTMSISWALSSTLAGRLMVHTGYRTTAMIGGAALTTGSIALVALTPERGPLWVGAGAMLVGIGMGFSNTTYLVSIQAAVAPKQRGAATASNMFCRLVGQSVGAALFGGIVNAGVMHIVPQAQDAAANLMEPTLRRSLSVDELMALTQAMAAALENVHLVAALAGVVALVIASRLPRTLDATAPPSGRSG